MEQFKQFKEKTEIAIKDLSSTSSDLATWKSDIRDMVMRVRA